jgi:hypothetical protein
MPDSVVTNLIAHELFHVDQWATGRITDDVPDIDLEDDVAWLMHRHGFDYDATHDSYDFGVVIG